MGSTQIWAPWRLSYVQGIKDREASSARQSELELLPGADSACFVCQAVADSDDRGRLVVQRGKHSIVILNLYPYNNGHLLIAPKEHLAGLDDIPQEQQVEMVQRIGQMVGLLQKTIHPHGFNVGLNLGRAAGAGLPGHLHWHVVPRWDGDTNFMPVLASVDIIPQSLDALWEALINALAT